ncbi:hypothetical protein ABZ914_33845 [Spirillospora sp. NPDC046719]
MYLFETARQRRTKDPSIVLMEVAQGLCKLLFDAIVAAPATGARYVDVANQMLQISAGRGDPVGADLPGYRVTVDDPDGAAAPRVYEVRGDPSEPSPIGVLLDEPGLGGPAGGGPGGGGPG